MTSESEPAESQPHVEAPQSPGRIAASRRRIESTLRAGRGRLDDARSTSNTVAVAFDAYAHDGEAGGTVFAAALGFRAFLFQIPYFCFLLLLAGYIADLFNRQPHDFLRGQGIGALTAAGIANASKLSGGARFTATVVAAYALFLGARSFVKVIRIVHALVWAVPLVKMLRPTMATLAVLGVVTSSVAVSVLIAVIRDRFLLGALTGLVLFMLTSFGTWLFISWYLPHRECQIWVLAPGAALFAVGVQVLHVFTVIWLPHVMQSKSETYGAIGIALALLLWAYLLGRIITLAVVLNFALWERREQETPGVSLKPLRLPIINDSIGLLIERVFPPRGTPGAPEPRVDD